MARKSRFAPGGLAYQVMNRTWGKMDLFEDAGDYEAFERVLAEALGEREKSMRLCEQGVHDGIGGTLSNGFGGARMPLTQPFDDRQECLSYRIEVVVPPKASCTLRTDTGTHLLLTDVPVSRILRQCSENPAE